MENENMKATQEREITKMLDLLAEDLKALETQIDNLESEIAPILREADLEENMAEGTSVIMRTEMGRKLHHLSLSIIGLSTKLGCIISKVEL